MGDRVLRYWFRNVAVKKDTVIRLIDKLDANEDGRVSLGEIAAALKALWRAAMGKTKEKRPKVRTVD